jgi:hypothetical protein
MSGRTTRNPPPFTEGEWVTPVSRAHPMHGKRALVQSCSYEGDGAAGYWIVRVTFENVHPKHRKVWSLRHQDLAIAVSAEVAAGHRRHLNL